MIGAARGVAFAGMMLLAGSGFYAALLRRIGITARLPGRVFVVAATLIATAAWTVLAAGAMAGAAPTSGIVQAAVTETLFGRLAILRLLLLLALFALRGSRATALLAGIALLSPAATSHAAASSPAGFAAIGTVMDGVHLAAASFWIGGLALLAALFARREARIVEALALFSDWAMVAVALLTVTGMIDAVQILLGEHGADAPLYLTVLGVKLALVTTMLVLAAANRFRLMPKGGIAQVGRNAGFELALGLTAVMLAGWLGQLPPTR
jgi:putative copper export protein